MCNGGSCGMNVINLVPRAFSSTIFKMTDIRHFENRRGEGPGDEVGMSFVKQPALASVTR